MDFNNPPEFKNAADVAAFQAAYDAAKAKHEATFGYSFEKALSDQATFAAIKKAIKAY